MDSECGLWRVIRSYAHSIHGLATTIAKQRAFDPCCGTPAIACVPTPGTLSHVEQLTHVDQHVGRRVSRRCALYQLSQVSLQHALQIQGSKIFDQ